jgi:hypothetical protein
MTLRAPTNNAFLMKYLIISLICIGFGIWATYDAFVGYPAMMEKSQVWEELLKDKALDDAAKDARYKEIAAERGWPSKRPTKDETVEKIKSNIIWQYIFMAIGYGIGVPLLIWYFLNQKTWIELEGHTIHSSWGQKVHFKDIQLFDKKKWDKKGIGVIHYQQDQQDQKFIIDDLKYDRKITDGIVRLMEAQLKPEQIINGDPEKLPEPEGGELEDFAAKS